LGESPKRIIALIGPNGCGKSSVLDGIMYSIRNFVTLGVYSQKEYKYHSMLQVPNYSPQNVLITFDQGEGAHVFTQRRNINNLESIFSFRSPYRYNSDLDVKEAKAMRELRLNNYGASTASDLDNKMEENYRRLYIRYNNYLNSTDSRPSEAKAKIIGELNSSLKNCLDLELSSLGNIEDSKGTLFFKKSDHTNEFDFNVLSSGEKEVVDILLDLYLRQDVYNDTVFLLDEPELHINTSIQKKLLIEINKLIGENCQLWITTHSIGFMRALQEEFSEDCQILLFKEGMALASKEYFLEPEKNIKWKDVFNIALDDLSHLLAPKRIVYCEGKDRPGANGEEKGFDAKVFNSIFSVKYPDTVFVSSGGNTELDQRSQFALSILTKVFSDIEILVFKDRDFASGKQTTEKDRLEYLKNNPDHHRVMKRWEIENYLFDKEVLKKYCLDKGYKFAETEYDEFLSDIMNQNLKDKIGHIKNFCNVVGSINPEKFKLNLAEYITEETEVYRELERHIFSHI